MNAERLIQLYDRIADAPDAVSRLRRFVLDLAVRGKLVEQDPEDEPASELLRKISEKKQQLVKAGEIKPKKELEPVGENPFDIPESWVWTRLGDITSYIQRGKSPKYATSNGYLVISQKCVQWSGLDLSVAKKITEESLADYGPIRFVRDGDLLWNSTGTGTIGRVIRVESPPEKLVCDSHVTVVRCLIINSEYIRTWLRTDDVYGAIEGSAAGSTNQVELTAHLANNQPVPLPPLAEQHRIVAKVDELMTLCDRLEETHNTHETTRDRLTTATLTRLIASDTDKQSVRTHARFALDTLPALTTRLDQIKTLRQTILNLAVRGKLVEQDPEDESAAKLLASLVETRAWLISDGTLKRSKKLQPITQEEFKSDMPPGWALSRLGTVFDVRDGTHNTPKYVDTGYPLVTSKNLSTGHLSFENTKMIGEADYRQISERSAVERGDILFAMIGSIGNPVIVDTDRKFSIKNVALFKYLDREKSCPGFLKYFLVHASNEMKRRAVGGLQPFVSLGFLRNFPLLLPPLAEQRRIVAKLDELMALCDRLEANLNEADIKRDRLLESLLAEALSTRDEELKAA